MKKYLKRFMRDEEGAELIQFIIVIAIAAVLAVMIIALVNGPVRDLISDSKAAIDGIVIPTP